MLGAPSGGLCCRDFDTVAGFEQWKAAHPELAAALPTARTHRGFHVYFKAAESTKNETFEDGELRADRVYTLLPPSQHPLGGFYAWMSNPLRSSMRDITASRGDFSQNRLTASVDSVSSVSLCSLCLVPGMSLEAMVERAVIVSTPSDEHRNHKMLFQLARACKSIEQELGRKLSDREVESVFARWHDASNQFYRDGKGFDDYLFEFLSAVDSAKFALGDGAVTRAWAEVKSRPLPSAAMRFENPELRLVVALCQVLQRIAGEAPFYLSVRTAQTLLRHETHNTAAFWMRGLVRRKVLRIVEKGGPATKRATRYRYLPPMDEGVAEIEELK
jgi:hypothetical protein